MTVFIVLLLILPLGYLAKKTKMPVLIYYLMAGIIMGPYALGYLNFNQGPLIRQLALVIIMLRSGLGLSIESLKKVGKPAILLSFVPGILEASTISLMAYFLFDFTLLQGIILGFMLAAVSPAVVVPAMLKLQDKKIGKNIPTMILASSALDDVIALSFFTFFTSLYFNQATSLLISLALIPIKMIFSFTVGYLLVYLISKFEKFNILIVVIVALLASFYESLLPISALILIMAMGISLSKNSRVSADILITITKHLWTIAQVFLFVSVGSDLDILALQDVYVLGLILIIVGIIARSIGVMISVNDLSRKEQLFSVFAFMPKATVQAALASVPLSMGIVGGDLMLLMAVLSIIVTTPIGATLISLSAPKLLYSNKQ